MPRLELLALFVSPRPGLRHSPGNCDQATVCLILAQIPESPATLSVGGHLYPARELGWAKGRCPSDGKIVTQRDRTVPARLA